MVGAAAARTDLRTWQLRYEGWLGGSGGGDGGAIVGALIGGFVFQLVLGHSYAGWIGSTVVAFVGAVILLFIIRAFSRRRAL